MMAYGGSLGLFPTHQKKKSMPGLCLMAKKCGNFAVKNLPTAIGLNFLMPQ